MALGAIGADARAERHEREVPDYDGRDEPTEASDVLLWVPRIALFPAYVVSEYLVRQPLGAITTAAERAELPELLYEVFIFGDGDAGLIPIAFVDFGFDPSVGLYFFANDVGATGHDVRVRASTWGYDWLALRLTDRYAITRELRWTIEGSAVRRPDYVFYGLGPRTLESDRSRYRATHFDARIGLELDGWRSSRLRPSLGARRTLFHGARPFDEDPALDTLIRAGEIDGPPGYRDSFTLIYSRLAYVFDSRESLYAPSSGVQLEAVGEHDANLSARGGFVRYSGRATGYLDLNDRGRVASLSFEAHFVDPVGRTTIPFTELVSIGGDDAMRGFFPGRLYGRSSAVATLGYRWPIWTFLDGTIRLATGNVFGPQLSGFAPRLLRLSGTIGIESVSSPDSAFELLLGVGSETYAHGLQLTSIRAILGTNHGF